MNYNSNGLTICTCRALYVSRRNKQGQKAAYSPATRIIYLQLYIDHKYNLTGIANENVRSNVDNIEI